MKRPPKTHRLKTRPDVFEALISRLKTHEYRRDDRPGGFEAGDILVLEEYKAEAYTGAIVRAVVSFVNTGPDFGIPEGFAVMSIAVMSVEAAP